MNTSKYLLLIEWLTNELGAAIKKGYASPSSHKEWSKNIKEALRIRDDIRKLKELDEQG